MAIFNATAPSAGGGGGGVEVKTATINSAGSTQIWWNLDHVPTVWWMYYNTGTYRQSYAPKWISFLDYQGNVTYIDTSGMAHESTTVTTDVSSGGSFHITIPSGMQFDGSNYTLCYID